MEIHVKIRTIREQLKLKPKDIYNKIDVSQQLYYYYEIGKIKIGISVLISIATAMKIHPAFFLTEFEPTTENAKVFNSLIHTGMAAIKELEAYRMKEMKMQLLIENQKQTIEDLIEIGKG